MTMLIKPAQLSDLNALNHLLRASKQYWGYDKQFMDKFMQLVGITPEHLQHAQTFLVYVKQKMVGFFGFSTHSDGVLELEYFFLHPDYIGKGHGRDLWHICCEAAKKLGKKEFVIWSDPNVEAFYIKMGCEKIGKKRSPMASNRYSPVLRYKIIY
jgi:streptomycin 6-kinase